MSLVFRESMKDLPGKSEFAQADDLISIYRRSKSFGNSEQAKVLAEEFSVHLKQLDAGMFTGGSGLSVASSGHFLTYCQMDKPGVAFIVHVPELRNYKGNALDALAKLAWTVGQATLREKEEVDLIIGLRGFSSYGLIIEGTSKSESFTKTDAPGMEKKIYSYFPETDEIFDSEK